MFYTITKGVLRSLLSTLKNRKGLDGKLTKLLYAELVVCGDFMG
jgi:hypothetical protein